jgi:capsule polysaccharide export protein KpsC/LpsZ
MKNVRILDYKANVSKLLCKLDLMVTLTGTIGWEAALLRIPVLYYGYPWYSGLPGTQKYNDMIDLEEFIETSKDRFKQTDYKKVYEIMKKSILEVTTKLDGLSENEFHQKALILKFAIEEFCFIKENMN